MNRDNSFETMWRAKLTEHLSEQPSWVLDIHSFPPGSLVVDGSPLTTPMNLLVSDEDWLGPSGDDMVSVVHGSDDNSIVRQARNRGLRALLIEFEESERGLEAARNFDISAFL